MVGPSVLLRNYQIFTHFVPLDLEGATNYLLDRQMAHSASFVGEGTPVIHSQRRHKGPETLPRRSDRSFVYHESRCMQTSSEFVLRSDSEEPL